MIITCVNEFMSPNDIRVAAWSAAHNRLGPITIAMLLGVILFLSLCSLTYKNSTQCNSRIQVLVYTGKIFVCNNACLSEAQVLTAKGFHTCIAGNHTSYILRYRLNRQ